MQLSDYLHPVSSDVIQQYIHTSPKSMVNVMDIHSLKIPDLQDTHIAIVGVEENRFAHEGNASKGPDAIRKELYQLIRPKHELKLADLGNIRAGETMNDTLFALNAVVHQLLRQKIVVLILGGTQDLAYAQYTAYQQLNRALQLVCIDADIELLPDENQPEASNYLHKIVAHQPGYLFNISHLGAQQYYIEQESMDAFERMHFDIMRLGLVQQHVNQTEPLLRSADAVIASLNAIRASDAPGSMAAHPNGLYGEQACQLMRYAGASTDVNTLGIYDFDIGKEIYGRTAKLAAQMLWYFIDGFYNRKLEYPAEGSNDYTTYRTLLHNSTYEIVFYKHVQSDRWWMEVPYPNERSKHAGKYRVPCSYADYQAALQDEIPDRWMKAYQKLML